jgi:HD superfamily phosphohydrolase
MIVRDVLYGKFEIPSFLVPFVTAPEFRRLSEIRLININSASLAALADVTRYSHTLGAIRLALANPLVDFGRDEHEALLATIIVHDAGTPAFAHLFEYFLLDRFNWDHEAVVPLLLTGKHHPDAFSHQIYKAQVPKFKKICKSAKIDFDLVLAMLDGRHPGSRLIFGSLDFDNIDNVARMNWMLGQRFDIDRMVSLASVLGARNAVSLLLPESRRADVELWATLRRSAYEVLVFDGPTVAGQAVLSRAIAGALADGVLSVEDWHYTDSELLNVIRESSPEGKLILNRDFYGGLPELQLIWHLEESEHPLMEFPRDLIASSIEEFLRLSLNIKHAYGYCLRDRGTFEKRIEAVDPKNGERWSFGRRSNSLVVYGFGKEGRKMESPWKLGEKFIKWMEQK